MYPEVSYPSRLLYSIYTERCLVPQDSCTLYIPTERHNAIQPTIIRNIFILHIGLSQSIVVLDLLAL
jgi:hypothetical protein